MNDKLGDTILKTESVYISLRKAALFAGVGYLLSFIGAIFATYATNSENVIASEELFRSGIFSFLIAIIGDMFRAWALFIFFKPISKHLALISAWFMLVHDAIFGAALVNLVLSSILSNAEISASVFEVSQIGTLNSLFLDGFNIGFEIGLFFFSFHLGILGYLVWKSANIPRIFSILLFIASFGYILNSSIKILLPNPPEILWNIFIAPCFIGELAIILWLVIKGGKETLKE